MLKLLCTLFISLFYLSACATEKTPYQVVGTLPHNTALFTQGLVISNNSVYESSGHYKQSLLQRRALTPHRDLLNQIKLPDKWFAEGIATTPAGLWLLTWKQGIASLRNPNTLEEIKQLQYNGQGWGLTFDGKQLILSNGSNTLQFFDPLNFKKTGEIAVQENTNSVDQLNELEFIKGQVYANIWRSERIIRINPKTGFVTGELDLSDIAKQHRDQGVLNGIAWDAVKEELWVTGKHWPWIYRLSLE